MLPDIIAGKQQILQRNCGCGLIYQPGNSRYYNATADAALYTSRETADTITQLRMQPDIIAGKQQIP